MDVARSTPFQLSTMLASHINLQQPAGARATRLQLLALAGATMLLTQTLAAQGADRITFRGRDIAVYNLVGRMRVTGGGSSATAMITRHGRDASKLTIANSTIGGRDALRVLYPDDRISVAGDSRHRMRTDLRVRDDGTFGNDDNNNRSINRDRSNGRNDAASNRDRSRYEGRRVEITSERGGMEASADIELQVPDGTSVRLHLALGDVVVNNINGDLSVDSHGADVTVSDVKGTLDINTGSGNTSVTNVTGDMSLDTGSGDVTGKNLTGANIAIDTGSGTVVIDGCAGDKVGIDTGSGELRITGLRTRNANLDTGSGRVQLGLLNTPDVITIDSGSGNVTLTLPTNFAASLNIDTGSGRVTSDFPMQLSSSSRDHVLGRIGTGGGRVVIESGSGNVRLIRAN